MTYARNFKKLYQLKIDLGAGEVHADDLDGDLVAQNIVLGMLDGDHMDESFAAGLVELDKETEIGDAGDETGEDLAYMVLHPHGLEEFDRVAFSLRGFLFTSGTMLAFILQFLSC